MDYSNTYVIESKKNINNYIFKNDHKKAFALFLLVIQRLEDGDEKNEFIKYYEKLLVN
jgi:hypothetical protein